MEDVFATPRQALRLALPLLTAVLSTASLFAVKPTPAATAINDFGVELHQRLAAEAPGDNLCVSPYSIQSALAMTFAGAAGATRDEMAKVLRYTDSDRIHGDLAQLATALQAITEASVKAAATREREGGHLDPIVFTIANRLFGKKDYTFEKPFLDLLSGTYHAPLEPIDFARDPEAARTHINGWVETQTRRRIRDLIPSGGVGPATELVLVNAIYLKAPWSEEFFERNTQPAPFSLLEGGQREVPTMRQVKTHGYAQREGFRAITLAYAQGGLHFLILLPDDPQGLPALEKKLTSKLLSEQAQLPTTEIDLFLPKFKLEPPTIPLGGELKAMGMRLAFDENLADFSKMATRPPGEGLVISEVYHKTFLAVDEKGTEAAAATAVAMLAGSAYIEKPKPIEVKVDCPFLFAIQHRDSGACLFLGRVTTP